MQIIKFNIGLGLGYKLYENTRGSTYFGGGIYKDSGNNWAKIAGVGYQYKLDNRWEVGADLMAVESKTYNKGRTFVAPIPRLTYNFGTIKLNAIYVPKFQKYNVFSVFAVFLSVPLWQ